MGGEPIFNRSLTAVGTFVFKNIGMNEESHKRIRSLRAEEECITAPSQHCCELEEGRYIWVNLSWISWLGSAHWVEGHSILT
jgi:hypothetical protein